MPLILKPMLAALLSMGAKLLSEVILKHVVLSILDYYVASYEAKAAKTEQKSDDLKAAKLRELYELVEERWSDDD